MLRALKHSIDFTRDADYDDSASDMEGMTGSRGSLVGRRSNSDMMHNLTMC